MRSVRTPIGLRRNCFLGKLIAPPSIDSLA
jgi:hypothetical protein